MDSNLRSSRERYSDVDNCDISTISYTLLIQILLSRPLLSQTVESMIS